MAIRELSFASAEPVNFLPYFCYQVQLNTAVHSLSQPNELGRLASTLKWQHQVPILADIANSAIFSPIPLKENDHRYSILAQEQINLAEQQYEYFLFQVCNFALCRAFASAKSHPRVDPKLKRIYASESTVELSANESASFFAGKRYLTFDFIRDIHNHLILIIDFASEYYSRLTLDQLGLENLSIGDKLIHTYDGKSCEFVGIGEATLNTPLSELGNNSIVQYHLQKGHLAEASLQSLDLSKPVVKVRYSSKNGKDWESAHIAQLLRQLYDREDIDNDFFNEQIWPISEKVKKATESIRFLNTKNRFSLNGHPIGFSISLRQPEKLQFFLAGSRAKNLDFGYQVISGKNEQVLVSYPTAGVGNYYLLDKPTEIRATVLFPQRWEIQAQRYTDLLKIELQKFGIELKRVSQPYDPHNQLQIRQICQEIKEACNFAIAFVPKPGEPYFTREVNPYKLIKKQLILRQIPSQMITKSTLDRGWNSFIGRNLILGINAKLGYLSWQLQDMPGTAQAFLGLDIGRKDNIAVGASAFFINARGATIGWSSTQFQAYGETFDPEQLKNLLWDLVGLYQRQFQQPLKHLVIHRDGTVKDDEFQIISTLKTQLAATGLEQLDVVEIIKSGTCRGVWYNPEHPEHPYTNPKKGWAWEHCRNQAVILTTGQQEAKVSPNSSPRPLRIRRRMGETDILTLAEQVYWLSEMQVGSTQTIRLPITTYYADRAAECALKGLIPVGIQQQRCLWFL